MPDFVVTSRGKTRALFVTAIVLLCVGAASTYLSFAYFRKSEQSVSHTQEVRAAVGDVEAAASSAARARTSYVLFGSANDLAEYGKAMSHVSERLELLQRLIEDNPVQLAHFETLKSITESRRRAWDSAVAQKQRGEVVDLSALMPQSVDLGTKSDAEASAIRTEEARLLRERVRRAHQRFQISTVLVVTSFVLALFLLCFYYRLLSRELSRREQAERAAHEAYESESALRQEEKRFRLFIQAVKDYAIFTLDPQGNVSSWNEGAQRLKGYEASEVIGKHFSRFFLPEDVEQGKPQRELEIASRDGRVEDEGWRVRKDGSRFWADVIVTAIHDSSGQLIGFAKVTRDFTDRMEVQEQLRRANAGLLSEIEERRAAQAKLATSERLLRELSFHLLRTQDEERRRIGRDLHDSLGQYLVMLKMNLDSLSVAMGPNHDGLGQMLSPCIRLTEDAIREVRTIAYLLYPPMLEEMGLKSAIPWYLDGFSRRSNIKTTFEVDPEFGRVAPAIELALFRILQESLTNVHRHSGSARANIRLFREDENAVLEIRDWGKGIPSHLLEESGEDWMGSLGVGLRGMNERMRQLGGKLEVYSSEEGTVVNASVPVGERMALTRTG